MEATPSMMLTTVKILIFDVCFGVHKDINRMPTFLMCFPNVETLHVKVISSIAIFNAVTVAAASITC
jgi:hypothetical protein